MSFRTRGRRCDLTALLLLSALVPGCPGSLEDRDRYLAACGTPDSPVCTTTTSTMAPTTAEVSADIFVPSCGFNGCHRSPMAEQDLDLFRPDLERLAGRTSTSAKCNGESLLVPGDPEASLLFDKLGSSPRCGSPMPPVPLSDDQRAYVRAWIEALEE